MNKYLIKTKNNSNLEFLDLDCSCFIELLDNFSAIAP